MSELEKIFDKYSTITVNTFVGQRRVMNSDQFTQALTEVLKLVKVTDEEVKSKRIEQSKTQKEYRDNGGYFKPMDIDDMAKWMRSLSKQKLEKLLKR